ncbi:23S rRNA (guanosine(2251)-2'-O)-methyltransferase RlmB [Pueribacillus theae]|uniref:23S rRNA (Guanosine(2251)-2'-O)-methyltransferase RlmB n=1 Tax=Pueribacillus theae TaxID=2171751 RepID=A0A2U1K605_9BACI|nr:23S rRNA (guanosine(2251)-2'-O)-methyltransferase RlmB [Pueribacillus theae]PWA12971.1 23S rRNA (guanosine(2251)-2'-O)-methyltransferase RlmB [Pueribacillus theae]
MESELIMGRNPVLEALRSNREINKLWVNEGSRGGQMNELIELAKKNGVLIQFVPKQKLDRLVNQGNHQGVVASIAAYNYAGMDELFQRAEALNEAPFFLLLDEIEDPHNLGSILRTAECVGVHGIIIPKRRSVGLTAAVAKASTGAIEHVPVVRVGNLAQTMDELKERGLWFVGADAKGKQDFREADYDMPVGLVIGSEGKGIGRLIKQKCDFLVRLPMKGKVTSLNASVAAGVLMYEVLRKRSPIGG